MDTQGWVIVVIAVVGLVIALALLKYLLVGAAFLFGWASSELGFIGVVIYFACWVFLFPAMLIGSVVFGFFARDTGDS